MLAAADLAWQGPRGGLPPLGSVTAAALDAHYRAEIAALREVALAVADDPARPSFANTLLPLQMAEHAFDQAEALLRHVRNTAARPEDEATLADLAALRGVAEDELAWHPTLFARIAEIAGQEQLTTSERRTARLVLSSMRARGAGLAPAKLTELKTVNAQLAALEARFQANLLADTKQLHAPVEDIRTLAGVDAAMIEVLRREAQTCGVGAPYCVPCARPVVDAILAQAENRALRERVWRMWAQRGSVSNPPLVAEILNLRARKAALLGYANYADLAAADRMARNGDRALELVETIAREAVKAAARHEERLSRLPQARSIGSRIEPWDRPFLNDILSKGERGFNAAQLSEYLLLDSMIEGMFWAAGTLYQCTFTRRDDLYGWREDVSAWEVRQYGELIGVLWLDLFRREGKRALAWMDCYRGRLASRPDEPALTAIHHYLTPPAPGEPVLLSWEDARVLFHELGHALHALLTVVDHPTQSMAHVAWDMIELPSQLFEHLVTTPEVLGRFARHYRTGAPMPEAMQRQLAAGGIFDPGAFVLSLAGPALVDLHLHRMGQDSVVDAERVERRVLAEMGMPRSVAPRHGVMNFAHVFADAYAAGYYCYHWADVMVADAIEVFEAAGGLFHADTARRFETALLGVGAAVPPGDAYRAFARREPAVPALIRKLGLDL